MNIYTNKQAHKHVFGDEAKSISKDPSPRRATNSALPPSGKNFIDNEETIIVNWANNKVAQAYQKNSHGNSDGPRKMTSFKDTSLKSSLFFLDLIDAIVPGYKKNLLLFYTSFFISFFISFYFIYDINYFYII